MTRTTPLDPQLDNLIALFYDDPSKLGHFFRTSQSECPEPYRRLLAHQAHMTVTVEKRHGQSVDVQVLGSSIEGQAYRRKILLRRRSDQRIVQFGIVRLDLNSLPKEVQLKIQSESVPLGRILIENDVLRQVRLSGLWRVHCGDDLAEHFSVPIDTVTYGRTAQILVDSVPTVELLEIVAPEDTAQ